MITIAATTIRMILSALLPPVVGAGGGGAAGAACGVGAPGELPGRVDARTGAPHLLQNRIPGVMVVPQELQNAIHYLAVKIIPTREYIADGEGFRVSESKPGAGFARRTAEAAVPT